MSASWRLRFGRKQGQRKLTMFRRQAQSGCKKRSQIPVFSMAVMLLTQQRKCASHSGCAVHSLLQSPCHSSLRCLDNTVQPSEPPHTVTLSP